MYLNEVVSHLLVCCLYSCVCWHWRERFGMLWLIHCLCITLKLYTVGWWKFPRMDSLTTDSWNYEYDYIMCMWCLPVHYTIHTLYSQRLMSADHTHPELNRPVQLNLQTDYEVNFTQEDNLSTTIHVHPVNPILKNFRSYKLSCCTTEVSPLTGLSVLHPYLHTH